MEYIKEKPIEIPKENTEEKLVDLIHKYTELKAKYEELKKRYEKQNAQLLNYMTRYGAIIDKKIKK